MFNSHVSRSVIQDLTNNNRKRGQNMSNTTRGNKLNSFMISGLQGQAQKNKLQTRRRHLVAVRGSDVTFPDLSAAPSLCRGQFTSERNVLDLIQIMTSCLSLSGPVSTATTQILKPESNLAAQQTLCDFFLKPIKSFVFRLCSRFVSRPVFVCVCSDLTPQSHRSAAVSHRGKNPCVSTQTHSKHTRAESGSPQEIKGLLNGKDTMEEKSGSERHLLLLRRRRSEGPGRRASGTKGPAPPPALCCRCKEQASLFALEVLSRGFCLLTRTGLRDWTHIRPGHLRLSTHMDSNATPARSSCRADRTAAGEGKVAKVNCSE